MLELGGVEEMLDLVVHFLKMGYVLVQFKMIKL